MDTNCTKSARGTLLGDDSRKPCTSPWVVLAKSSQSTVFRYFFRETNELIGFSLICLRECVVNSECSHKSAVGSRSGFKCGQLVDLSIGSERGSDCLQTFFNLVFRGGLRSRFR